MITGTCDIVEKTDVVLSEFLSSVLGCGWETSTNKYSSCLPSGCQQHHNMASNSSSPIVGHGPDIEPPSACRINGDISTQDIESTGADSSTEPVYSVFTGCAKLFIVFVLAFAGFLSTLSAHIYFPLLPTLAEEMHVSNSLINLTIFSFMVFQGLAPTVLGALADIHGRRPAYTLAFVIYFISNVGLARQDSLAALFLLRCLQSTGISGCVALGSGVVADIITNGNRGTYMAYLFGGIMLGATIGPVIGGTISQYLGWRAVFWFLAILCGIFMVPFLIFFPETGRNTVGNGSVPPAKWNMSIINCLQMRKPKRVGQCVDTSCRKVVPLALGAPGGRQLNWPNPLRTVYIILEKDVGIVLLYDALAYTTFYCVVSSTPSMFRDLFNFNDLQLGLCYLYVLHIP